MDEEKLDIFNPAFIMGFIMALMSDISFLFLLTLAIPVIGLVIAIFILLGHYIVGFIVGFLVFPRTRGILAKLALGLAIILPLPLLWFPPAAHLVQLPLRVRQRIRPLLRRPLLP